MEDGDGPGATPGQTASSDRKRNDEGSIEFTDQDNRAGTRTQTREEEQEQAEFQQSVKELLDLEQLITPAPS